MNNKIELKECKKIGFFKGWVLSNFPYIEQDFDALTNYEIICKMTTYLNKIVENTNCMNDNVNSLADAFNNLKNYVDSQFENLNLEDEVNAKIDEMVESGKFAEILGNFINDNIPKFYSNVETLKESNLQENAIVVTLGYYNPGDSGNATYLITATSSQEGYYESLNNGMFAKLIVKNNQISPQQFGAYADNIHDDSEAIQKCVDFAENIVIKNNSVSAGEPEISLYGNYKIEKGIILSPYLTYNLKGDATIISYLEEGIAVSLEYRTIITSELNQNRSNGWSRGDTFYGGNLFIVNSENSINSNVIGLQINNEENLNNINQAFSRGRIQNISVAYFKIGIKINVYHLYIESFFNINLHHNNIDLKIGNEGLTNIDSGENILFQNCLFGTSVENGLIINVSSLNITFENCSFDYNFGNTIQISKQTSIRLTNCHIEDCHAGNLKGLIATVNDDIFGQVYLNNILFIDARDTEPLIYGKNLSVIIDDIRESTLTSLTNQQAPSNFYLIGECLSCTKRNMESNIRMTAELFNELRFRSLADEVVNSEIVQGGNTSFVKFYGKNAYTTMKIASDNNENVISISAIESQLLYGSVIFDEYIHVKNLYNRSTFMYLFKFSRGTIEPRITFFYYDEDKKSLGSKQWTGSGDNMLQPSLNWQKPLRNAQVQGFPLKTKYVRVRLDIFARSYVDNILIKQPHFEFK